ncbi:MAG TPA: PLP-dependent aminotransferase family protein [Thermomicrobiales bacterium]|nr:PLP-dependent aminotransferase family protein [Thermomicrobiales bacterium]
MTTSTATATRRLSDRFATRTGVFGDSIWTGILEQFKKHDDPVYFGDGAPAQEIIPVERLREASARAWEDAPGSLSYGDQQGYAPLRDLVASRIAARGIEITGDDVLITQGSTQAIDLACRVFLEPGDAIIVEKPTFLGALEIFRLFEVEIVAVDLDEDGMQMDALETALIEHPNAKAIYTIPTFQNPTGSSLPLERRQRMIELAREHTVAIFEDDPYGELQYSGEALPPLRALDDEVIHLGTFSKTITPGIRTGFAIASPAIMEKMLGIRESTDISNDRVMMRTVYHAANGFLDGHIARACDVYRARRDAMLAAMDEYMPEGVRWSRPNGGFFVWITLPEGLDAHEVFESGSRHGVIAFPGEWFYPHREVRRDLRLSFSTVPEDRIRLGIQRLGETLREAMGG